MKSPFPHIFLALIVIVSLTFAAINLLDGSTVPTNPASVYTDSDNGISFIVEDETCRDYFEIAREVNDGTTSYAVNVNSETWTDFPWFSYSIISQEAYDQLDPNTPPGQPPIIQELDAGLLVFWYPQDLPGDVPEGCGFDSVKVEKL